MSKTSTIEDLRKEVEKLKAYLASLPQPLYCSQDDGEYALALAEYYKAQLTLAHAELEEFAEKLINYAIGNSKAIRGMDGYERCQGAATAYDETQKELQLLIARVWGKE